MKGRGHKGRIKKRGRANQLTEANIMVVIPETSNFKFKVPLNPSGKYKDAYGSIPKRLETWLEIGETTLVHSC
jgi:hypothetical protein